MTTLVDPAERAAVAASRTPRPIVIRRSQGTVVITVHGELDRPGATILELILIDLIDGQGNRNVVLDLAELEPGAPISLDGLRSVAERARSRGADFVVKRPAAHGSD